MKNISFFRTIGVAICLVLFSSCSAEDGAIGPQGPQGEQGIMGEPGAQGLPGTDGSSNLRSFTFDMSVVRGAFYDQPIPELTTEVLESHVVLGYLQTDANSLNRWYPIPNTRIESTLGSFDVRVFLAEGRYSLDFYQIGVSNTYIIQDELLSLRVVIIEPLTGTNGKSSKAEILGFLQKSGVDISDYESVKRHYGLSN